MFSHLHFHSAHSLLDGLSQMKDAFAAAAADSQPVLAVTDHGTLGGIWKAKLAAKAAGVRLAAGEEFYLALNDDGTLGDRMNPGVMETTDVGDDSDEDEGVKKKRYYHLTVIAYSRTGWENLVRIANASEHSKFGKYPMADMTLFKAHSEGLIALTGCLGGPVLGPVAHGDTGLARTNLASIVDAFGAENVFVEVMEHGIRAETLALPTMKRLGDEFGLRLVATNDAHYTHAEDAKTHDAWLALRTKATLDDPKRYRFTGAGYHLRTEAEMRALFAPDTPASADSLLADDAVLSALTALRNPLLRPMLGDGWSQEHAQLAAALIPEPAVLTEEQESQVRSRVIRDEVSAFEALHTGAGPALEVPEVRENINRVLPGALETARLRVDARNFRGALALETRELREFVARAAREQSLLDAFGRPSQNEHHPRNWWDEAVSNTALVAERVEADVVPDGNPKLPKFPTPDGYANNTMYLAHLVSSGADRVYGTPRPKEVSDRLTYEWSVIAGMGFIDYFLIDHDFVSWAKSTACIHHTAVDADESCIREGCLGSKVPILVGPGRGSAAGSLVAYVLGITGVDPLEHDLLFERFLEPGRADFPDIDIDFEKNRKEEVLDYLTARWGEGYVALIGTYGVSKTRRSIRDAARLLDEQSIGNALSKVIPVVEGNPMGFDDLLNENNAQTAEFRRELAKAGAKGQAVLDLALGFTDTINGASIHACGVVISDLYLPDVIPLRVHKNGRYITQWDSKDIESFGLIKFDVLALRNLDIAHTAMDYIFETTGERLSIETIPHPSTKGDPRVDRAWALLRDGRTAGIFQMEGDAMTALTQDVQPEGVDDLSAILALFRPGPISAGMPERYAMRKNGRESVDYGIYTADPGEQEALASVLGRTYGVLAYQESMMRLGTVVAGFDTAMRSKLRKAIGKKNKELMAQVKGVFLAGAEKEFRGDDGELISRVFRRDTADRLWAMFEGAASYAFNSSHSYAYGYLSYWTAYLKANWPGAYGAAILANTSDSDRRGEALKALPAEGIEVLPPDVNLSGAQSRPEGEYKVRLGLGEISGVGSAGERVVAERNESGEYRNLKELAHRVRVDDLGSKHLPSNQLIGLIESGALDAFGQRLGLTMVARLATEELPAPVPVIEWGVIERAARQRQRLGVSIGEHPLVVFQDQVKAWKKEVRDEHGNVEWQQSATPVSRIPDENGTPVTVIGLLSQWSEGSYRGGRKAALALEGSTHTIEGVMWDRELLKQKDLGIPPLGWPVAVTGKVTVREFEQEDESGGVSIKLVKQLTVSRVDVVDINDPVSGELRQDVPVPVLTMTADRSAQPFVRPKAVRAKSQVSVDKPENEAMPQETEVSAANAPYEPADISFDEPQGVKVLTLRCKPRTRADVVRALAEVGIHEPESRFRFQPGFRTVNAAYKLFDGDTEVVRLTLVH